MSSQFGSFKFCRFLKQKLQLQNKWLCVNCRAFHAASFGAFWLFIQLIKIENWNAKLITSMLPVEICFMNNFILED